jgi:hypothetical protein
MKALFTLLLALFCHTAAATMVEEMPIEALTRQATDIAAARVVAMVGMTQDGHRVTTGSFRTAPGMGNTIWVSLRITRVLKGKTLQKDMIQQVPLWSLWHMNGKLGRVAQRDQVEVIVFLKQTAKGLEPAFEPSPYHHPSVEAQVKQVLEEDASAAAR